MKYLLNKWISLPTVAVALLVLLQISTSIYRTGKAEKFVEGIKGTFVKIEYHLDEVERPDHGDIFIKWVHTDDSPPNCPVTIIGRYVHISTGLHLQDSPSDLISAEEFQVVHKTKNGHLSVEPIYSLEIAELFKKNPGLWEYYIDFKFHCSLVNFEWLAFLKFDKVFETQPVIMEIKNEDNISN